MLAFAAGTATAVAPEVKDEAKFFSPETIKKANAEIREIMRKYGKDVLIETFSSVPEGQVDKVKAMPLDERIKFFHTWATERMDAAVVNGVYILVCKNPARVHAEASAKARNVFDKKTLDKLSEILVSRFQKKEFDEGILAAIQFVREKLASSASK
jgi:uncharacterized membrane protein YgcG